MCVCVCVDRMECQARSSNKYQVLQVWCGLLTVAMVVMAAFITSIKPKSSEVSHAVSSVSKSTTHVGDACHLNEQRLFQTEGHMGCWLQLTNLQSL